MAVQQADQSLITVQPEEDQLTRNLSSFDDDNSAEDDDDYITESSEQTEWNFVSSFIIEHNVIKI